MSFLWSIFVSLGFASHGPMENRHIVFEAFVGQAGGLNQLLYDKEARQEFGSDRINRMRQARAEKLVYIVQTVDFQQAVVFLVNHPRSQEVVLNIETFIEIPFGSKTARGCKLEEKMVMPVVDRYAACYLNPDHYWRNGSTQVTLSISKLGDYMRTALEKIIAVQGLSADVAVFSKGFVAELQVLRDHLFVIRDVHEREVLPYVLLRSRQNVVDLRETDLWRHDPQSPAPEDFEKMVAAAHYLKSKRKAFIDRNHRCGRVTGPAIIRLTQQKGCRTKAVAHDAVKDLVQTLQKHGARWDSQKSQWL